MHAKTDSEVTSLAASSPPRSPRRQVYYVQSPSRDSHDGEKTATSFHSTPALSPVASPPHSHSSVGRHSRESSSTRFSGSLKPGSRKISPNDRRRPSAAASGKAADNPWKDCDIIEEEGLLDPDDRRNSIPRRCYVLAFFVGFFLLFSLFSLILWGASKPMKPKITLKSMKFDEFKIQAGSDSTGVATDMITLNSTLRLTFRNTGTFFGVHVSSTPIDLTYSDKTVASGSVKTFYQSRNSQRSLIIPVMGNKIPLYGSGVGLSTPTGTTTLPVAMRLRFVIRARAYVLGKLVKTKFNRGVECNVTYDPSPKKLNKLIDLNKSCKID